jgi:hypothetical protein
MVPATAVLAIVAGKSRSRFCENLTPRGAGFSTPLSSYKTEDKVHVGFTCCSITIQIASCDLLTVLWLDSVVVIVAFLPILDSDSRRSWGVDELPQWQDVPVPMEMLLASFYPR